MKNYKTAPFIVGTMRLGQWGSKMNISEIEKFIEDCIALDLIDFDHADIYGSYTTESDLKTCGCSFKPTQNRFLEWGWECSFH